MSWKIVLGTCIAASLMGPALASQSAAKGGFDEGSIRGVWGLSAGGQIMPLPRPSSANRQ